VADEDGLQARSFALNDYLCPLDVLNEVSAPPEDQDTSILGCSLEDQVRRRSAVSGMRILALD
jgi:hypothetical protein